MPASSQLIFTHYPLVTIWQLLEKPVTLEEFENLVPIKSAFFKYGLSVVSHRNAIIHVEEGEVTIVIGCSKVSFCNTACVHFNQPLGSVQRLFLKLQLNVSLWF